MEVSKRSENFRAADRWDVLEDEIPRGSCTVRGCDRQARYEWAGTFGTGWLCTRHRPLYRTHDRILRCIRSFSDRDILGG